MNHLFEGLSIIHLLVVAIAFGSMMAKFGRFQYLFDRVGRFESIDGLRGYLALAVFSHHFLFTYIWKKTGVWSEPPGTFFLNLGKVGVAVFFMISGFLFIGKLMASEKIDWIALYRSRVFRIYPLYLLALTLVFAVVLLDGGLVCSVPYSTLLKQVVDWMLFNDVAINNYQNSSRIIAGVVWTLRYEVVFYLFLPLIASVFKGGRLACLQFCFLTLFFHFNPFHFLELDSRFFILFIIGGIAAYLDQQHSWLKTRINHPVVTIFCLSTLPLALYYPSTLSFGHIVVIAAFFIPVALGNTLFGALRLKASLVLGEISYSIYLLHGFVLYGLFSLLPLDLKDLSISESMLWMPVVSVLVIALSAITFMMIEKPGLQLAKRIGK